MEILVLFSIMMMFIYAAAFVVGAVLVVGWILLKVLLPSPALPDGIDRVKQRKRSWLQNLGERERMLAREKRRRQARIRKAQQPYDQERSDENIAYWRAQLQQQGAAPKP